MGYLTTITIYNDALHAFRQKPKEFAEAIFHGIDKAYSKNEQVSVPFEGYCNYIAVEPSKHADDTQIYLHHGNCLTNLTEFSKDFKSLVESNPDLAEKFLKIAQREITESKKYLKENKCNQ